MPPRRRCDSSATSGGRLNEYAKEHHIDTIAVGARGRSRVARTLLGSTSNGLLHHATPAVLIVPGTATEASDGPVMFCDDGSDDARHAVRLGRNCCAAQAWWCRCGAPGKPTSHTWRSVAAALREWPRNSTAAETSTLPRRPPQTARVAAVDGTGCDSESVRCDGPTWRGLLDTANDRDAAAIVVGTRWDDRRHRSARKRGRRRRPAQPAPRPGRGLGVVKRAMTRLHAAVYRLVERAAAWPDGRQSRARARDHRTTHRQVTADASPISRRRRDLRRRRIERGRAPTPGLVPEPPRARTRADTGGSAHAGRVGPRGHRRGANRLMATPDGIQSLPGERCAQGRA